MSHTTPAEKNRFNSSLSELKKLIEDPRLSPEQKVDRIGEVTGSSKLKVKQVVTCLIDRLDRKDKALREKDKALQDVHTIQEALSERIEQLTQPPWLAAVFLEAVPSEPGRLARVRYNQQSHLVGVDANLDLGAIKPGDEVYLNGERNTVVSKACADPWPVGETAVITRIIDTNRLAIQDGDRERIIAIANPLRGVPLKEGDRVRWTLGSEMAFERLELEPNQTAGTLSQIDNGPAQALGGRDPAVDRLINRVRLNVIRPDLAATYRIGTVHGEMGQANVRVLLFGQPGCGKTTLMRVIAHTIGQATGQRCRIAVVNGSSLYSPFVGETERKIRDQIRALEEHQGPAILFLDELDAIGQIRGETGNVHGDRFLGTLLAELDGVRGQQGLIVIAATNRPDVLDPALRERFAWQIQMPRPNRRAAREIFAIHLDANLPYRGNGSRVGAMRETLLATAVSRLYDPNADNRVARLQFRDGSTRTVTASELMSGRLIQQVCKAAREAAFYRHAAGGEAGLGLDDLQTAIDEALDKLGSTLTVRNAASYLSDLPSDLDVVSVTPMRTTVHPHRYVRDAAGLTAPPDNHDRFVQSAG